MEEEFGTGNERRDVGEYNDEIKRVGLETITESDGVGLLLARKEGRC